MAYVVMGYALYGGLYRPSVVGTMPRAHRASRPCTTPCRGAERRPALGHNYLGRAEGPSASHPLSFFLSFRPCLRRSRRGPIGKAVGLGRLLGVGRGLGRMPGVPSKRSWTRTHCCRYVAASVPGLSMFARRHAPRCR